MKGKGKKGKGKDTNRFTGSSYLARYLAEGTLTHEQILRVQQPAAANASRGNTMTATEMSNTFDLGNHPERPLCDHEDQQESAGQSSIQHSFISKRGKRGKRDKR